MKHLHSIKIWIQFELYNNNESVVESTCITDV